MTQTQRELRGTYDRHCYDTLLDGFEDGDRVTLIYKSPYSGTEVEVEGDAQNVSGYSFTLELDDGREWGIFEKGIRTTKNSRRTSGRVKAKNGRRVGYVRELRIYAN